MTTSKIAKVILIGLVASILFGCGSDTVGSNPDRPANASKEDAKGMNAPN